MLDLRKLEIFIAITIVVAFLFTDFKEVFNVEPLGKLMEVILKAYVLVVIYDVLKEISEGLSKTKNKYLDNGFKVCKFLAVLIMVLIEVVMIIAAVSYFRGYEREVAIKLLIVAIFYGTAVFKIIKKEYGDFFKKKR